MTRWLDSWRGVGIVATGMHHRSSDLQLTEYGDGHWRATSYAADMVHSILGGSAWEPTPWDAMQPAAWQALNDRGCDMLLKNTQAPRVSP